MDFKFSYTKINVFNSNLLFPFCTKLLTVPPYTSALHTVTNTSSQVAVPRKTPCGSTLPVWTPWPPSRYSLKRRGSLRWVWGEQKESGYKNETCFPSWSCDLVPPHAAHRHLPRCDMPGGLSSEQSPGQPTPDDITSCVQDYSQKWP